MDPDKPMVGGGGGENGFGFAEATIDEGEAFQKWGQGTGADGDVAADLDIFRRMKDRLATMLLEGL